jgi:hypothetical protein
VQLAALKESFVIARPGLYPWMTKRMVASPGAREARSEGHAKKRNQRPTSNIQGPGMSKSKRLRSPGDPHVSFGRDPRAAKTQRQVPGLLDGH